MNAPGAQLDPHEISSLIALAAELRRLDRGWLFAQRTAGGLLSVDHLRQGDVGAIVFVRPPGDSGHWVPGETGYIVGGSKRFRVERVVTWEGENDVYAVLGTMEVGGFHASKPNFSAQFRKDSDAV